MNRSKATPKAWKSALEEFKWTQDVAPRSFQLWIARGIRFGSNPNLRYRFASLAYCCEHTKVISALIQGAQDQGEHFLVRGVCIEMLSARRSWTKRMSRRDRKIASVVLECLDDPHPNIRFWACFAAAGLRLMSAKSRLRDLRNDEGLGDMGLTVGYEASEALKELDGRPAWVESHVGLKSPYPSPLSLEENDR